MGEYDAYVTVRGERDPDVTELLTERRTKALERADSDDPRVGRLPAEQIRDVREHV